jgi:hypothetical protein
LGAVRYLIPLWIVLPLSLFAQVTSSSKLVVEEARTRVFIAEVTLAVSDLALLEVDGTPILKGRYEIRVPLRKSKNESGELFLPLDETGEAVFAQGGELTGWCDSETFPDAQRRLYCRFTPFDSGSRNGRLDLHIDLGNRTVKFVTNYSFTSE